MNDAEGKSTEGEKRYIVSYHNQGKKEKTPLLSDAMMRIAKGMLKFQGAAQICVKEMKT